MVHIKTFPPKQFHNLLDDIIKEHQIHLLLVTTVKDNVIQTTNIISKTNVPRLWTGVDKLSYIQVKR